MGFHGVEWVKLGFFFMVYGHPSMGIQASKHDGLMTIPRPMGIRAMF